MVWSTNVEYRLRTVHYWFLPLLPGGNGEPHYHHSSHFPNSNAEHEEEDRQWERVVSVTLFTIIALDMLEELGQAKLK